MRYSRIFRIKVEHLPAEDGDPEGYLATQDELGLVAEADTLDELVAKVRELVPELYEENIVRKSGDSSPPAFVIDHELELGQRLLP